MVRQRTQKEPAKNEIALVLREPQKDQKPVEISRLINSIYFSIHTCFIMKTSEEKYYRLLAINEIEKKILADESFRTIRGAKIHFMKKFKNKAWHETVVAEWSLFYQPDLDWIEGMVSIAEKFSSTN